jgi:hypothetical protein
MNGWWIEQFVVENRDGQNTRRGGCDLRYCEKCERVWSRIPFTSKQVYYSKQDIPYYGHLKKSCKECGRP